MKACGIVCIALGALWSMGVSLRERRRRRQALADLRAALARMAEEIRLSRVPLPELLDRLAANCGSDAAAFFHSVSAAVRRGDAPPAVWREAADALPLSERDCQTLRELPPVLRGDETQIRNAVELASARLERSLREMDHSAKAEIRRAAALIFSAAALLIILLY